MTDNPAESPSSRDVYEKMEVLEPYTTDELATTFDAPKQRIRDRLERLFQAGKLRKKEPEPEPERPIWVRPAVTHECSSCGYEYEVKFLHPVFSSVRFCPRCGTQI